MPRILSLETSTSVCSAAIHDDGKLIIASEIHEDQAHAGKLAPLVDSMLKTAEIDPASLTVIAVASGPGSYTGLRIGTSLAKGLCFSLNARLISVSALELMAWNQVKTGIAFDYLCPLLDARRMEVYYAIYNRQLERISEIRPLEVERSSFDTVLGHSTVAFFGPGSDKCRDVISHPNATFVGGVYPSAIELGELASKRAQRGEFEDLMAFEPLYLKEFLVKKSTKIAGVLNK